MDFFTQVHFGAVISTMLNELTGWDMSKPFCKVIVAMFLVGLVAQFLLLRMKWKPWVISLTLGCLVVALDFMCLMIEGFLFDLFGLLEMFFLAALVGAGMAGAVHIFWEIFKKRGDDEESVWMLKKNSDKDKKEEQ